MKTTPRLAANLLGIAVILSAVSLPAYGQNSRPRYTSPASRPQQSDVIAEDTIISLRMNDNLSSKTARVGDRFTATVTLPVYVGGAVVIPAGATVSGRVTQVTPARRMNRAGVLAIDFDEISLPNGLSTQIVGVLTSDDPEVQKQIDEENRMSGGKSKDSAVFIGGSGVLGAILGGVAGGGKGAAVGGAVGAGVGAASVLFSKGEEASVPPGTAFGLRLKQALPVPDEAALAAATNADANADNRAGNPTTRDANVSDSETAADVRARTSRPSLDRDGAARDSQPPDVQPANRTGEREPATTANADVGTPNEEPETVDNSLPLSSPEMIRRAQAALKQEGYYEGEIDGNLTPRTVAALKTYQRENNLPESGALDEATANSLKIRSRRAGAPPPAPRRSVPAPEREVGREGGQAANRSTTGGANTASGEAVRTPVSLNTESNRPPVANTGRTGAGVVAAAIIDKLQSQAEELLAEYQRMIGVRQTGTGLEFSGNATDDDIRLLFALDSLVNATQLYGRVIPGLQTPSAIRSATLAMAKEARKTDKVFTTVSSRWVNSLNPRWDALRQEVLKLMYAQNINTAELDD